MRMSRIGTTKTKQRCDGCGNVRYLLIRPSRIGGELLCHECDIEDRQVPRTKEWRKVERALCIVSIIIMLAAAALAAIVEIRSH